MNGPIRRQKVIKVSSPPKTRSEDFDIIKFVHTSKLKNRERIKPNLHGYTINYNYT
jgi:hypothetical protein